MNRIEYGIVAGFLAAAIGFAPIGFTATADAINKTGQVRAKSPAAKPPVIARVVVTPSPEQMANIRLEKRMTGLEQQTSVGQQAGNSHSAVSGAL